jgi:hypothetical protein
MHSTCEEDAEREKIALKKKKRHRIKLKHLPEKKRFLQPFFTLGGQKRSVTLPLFSITRRRPRENDTSKAERKIHEPCIVKPVERTKKKPEQAWLHLFVCS